MLSRALIILILFFFTSKVSIANIENFPQKVIDRIRSLKSTNDSLIVYNRTCSGCSQGSMGSTLILFKSGKKYKYEFFLWDSNNKKIKEHVVSSKRSIYISEVYAFVRKHYSDLNKYNGFSDLSGTMLSRERNDTATQGRVYPSAMSHGRKVECLINFGRESVKTGTSFYTNTFYHIEKYPALGTLFLLLNSVHLQKGYLLFLD